MSGFFSSGRAIDVALLVVLLEAAVLMALRHRTGRGLPLPDLIGQLLPGVLLMLALRSALTGASVYATALWMSASFPAHLFDVARRLRAKSRKRPQQT